MLQAGSRSGLLGGRAAASSGTRIGIDSVKGCFHLPVLAYEVRSRSQTGFASRPWATGPSGKADPAVENQGRLVCRAAQPGSGEEQAVRKGFAGGQCSMLRCSCVAFMTCP